MSENPLGKILLLVFIAVGLTGCQGDIPSEQALPASPAGRWDAEFQTEDGNYPSWWELTGSEESGWTGRFVGRTGNARDIQEIVVEGSQVRFRLPPQYEQWDHDLVIEGAIHGDRLEGTLLSDGSRPAQSFVARRAPELPGVAAPEWGDPVDLIGSDLSGWRLRDPEGEAGWTVSDGILSNTPPSVDLVTVDEFDDFTLALEFRIPEGSNSGVYLRGRYEVQISDSSGQQPHNRACGSIYGFLTPSVQAFRAPGEWNSYEITLVGRHVTLVFNGETVLDNEEIPGITGGALDSDEGAPGPLFLQGDHGPVEYRNMVLRRRR